MALVICSCGEAVNMSIEEEYKKHLYHQIPFFEKPKYIDCYEKDDRS